MCERSGMGRGPGNPSLFLLSLRSRWAYPSATVQSREDQDDEEL